MQQSDLQLLNLSLYGELQIHVMHSEGQTELQLSCLCFSQRFFKHMTTCIRPYVIKGEEWLGWFCLQGMMTLLSFPFNTALYAFVIVYEKLNVHILLVFSKVYNVRFISVARSTFIVLLCLKVLLTK